MLTVDLEVPLGVSLWIAKPRQNGGDIDNLAKSVLDAFTRASLWKDDSQVVALRVFRLKGPARLIAEIEALGPHRVFTMAWGDTRPHVLRRELAENLTPPPPQGTVTA